jgi:hypothetical protein
MRPSYSLQAEAFDQSGDTNEMCSHASWQRLYFRIDLSVQGFDDPHRHYVANLLPFRKLPMPPGKASNSG